MHSLVRRFKEIIDTDANSMDELFKEVERIANTVEKQQDEIGLLHHRLNLAKQRSEHIEHYLGMRHHKFAPGQRMWNFNQVQQDVASATSPKSLFHKGISTKKIKERNNHEHARSRRDTLR